MCAWALHQQFMPGAAAPELHRRGQRRSDLRDARDSCRDWEMKTSAQHDQQRAIIDTSQAGCEIRMRTCRSNLPAVSRLRLHASRVNNNITAYMCMLGTVQGHDMHMQMIFANNCNQRLYARLSSTPRSALHQAGLHRSEHKRQVVQLHQATSKIFIEFYIANKNIAKVYINVVFRRRRQKPRRRCDLRSPPPP
jgi:hypothetical protein